MAPMFIPGPAEVPPEVLAAQARPVIPHRSKEFEELFRRTEEKARRLFGSDRPVFQVACSGSGLQEAAMRNLVQSRVLCCTNGAFSEQWQQIAQANGKEADRLEVPWGEAVQPEQLAEALRAQSYEAVAIVHNETSTGVENPLPALAETVHTVSPDTLILVDAVSSLGGVKMEMDAWGLDFVLTASQKCLALPPGLALAAASERAMKKAESVPNRGWYFDLLQMERHRLIDSSPATPAVTLLYALDVQLDRIAAEGLENRFARHAALAERMQTWAVQNGFGLLAPEGFRSRTLTTLRNTRGVDVQALNKFLLLHGMRIANGYGKLKDQTFRIGHMGDTRLEDLEMLLTALEHFLAGTP